MTKSPAPIDSAKVEDTGEPVALPKDVLDALRFYAHGDHYSIDDDHQQFDTVSGEPANWLFSEKDDDCTMFEDGGIARAVLLGRSAGFEEPVEPVEGEVFIASPGSVLTDFSFHVRIARLLAEMNGDAILSEQQCAKLFGVDLMTWREIEHRCSFLHGYEVDANAPSAEELIRRALAPKTA